MKRLFSLTRALVARKRKIFALFFALAASIGLSWAATYVTITESDFPASGNSFTKGGVTVSAGSINGLEGDLTGGGSFSTTLGNFTKIEVNAGGIVSSGEGWSGNFERQTWTGNASSVSFSGDIRSFGMGVTIMCTIEDATTAVTGVTLNKSAAELTVGGENLTLIPTVLPSNATNKEVMWNSDNGYVAVVDNGVVIPVGPGTANITVTTVDGDYSATCVVTVTDAAPAPSGNGDKLAGKFSVSASQVVYFSRGNLQYQASTNTWRFAENQYDAVGGSNGSNNAAPYNTSSANHSPSDSQTGWIDLFGWAASGIDRTGVTAYQPYSTSTNNADYGTTTTKSASETLGNYDWGKNMGDGWRTLTAEEWGYLIGPGNGSTTPSEYRDHYQSLRGLCKITVSGTSYPGMIILPDDMYNNLPSEGSIASKWSACAVAAASLNYTLATFTEAEWTALQAAGAVFLPAAGYRYGTTVNYAGAYGDYWSSSASSNTYAFFLRFYAGYLNPENSGNRYNGRSVRLVSDIAPDPAPAGPIPCTAADLGKVLCTDGSIYATVSEAAAASKTAAAVIAYVDTQNGKALALALADDGGEMDWATAKTTAAAHTPAVSGGTWTLASKDEWDNMITAAGSYTALRDGFSAVGGTNMKNVGYWSSTSFMHYAWCYKFNNGEWFDDYQDGDNYVRACLAFDIPATPAYETVMNLINAIGEVAYTAECKAKIDEARAAYDALSDGDKAQITNIATLTTAEAAYKNLVLDAAQPAIAAIKAIPSPITSNLKLSAYEKVTAAREAYDALTDEEKAAIPEYLAILEEAEAAFAAIPSVGSETVITWDKNTGIEKISGTTTSPAYEGITISIKGGGFGPEPEKDMLRFNIAGLGLSFEFANTLEGNFQKIVISSTNAMPSTPLAGMGEGWAASNENKTATWTGDAATVKIWDGLTATSYWDVNTIQFTLGATVSATEAAQAAKDLIDAIPQQVVYTPECGAAIKAAREAVDALGENASLLENADLNKLTQAETTYAELLAQAVAAVKDQIDALPATPLTDATKKLSEYNKVTDAREAYDALSDEEKAAVTNYDKLEAAEAAFAAIGGGTKPVDIVWNKNTGIANVSPGSTSPAYEGMTVTTGSGSSFSQNSEGRMNFMFYSQNGGFTFANENGYNITKVVIESTTALTSTMTEVDRMGSGWAISNENKTATWTGDAATVKIWEGRTFTNYWYVDSIVFTVNGPASPLADAQAAKDLIDAIGEVSYPGSKEAIKAAREAVDALGANASLLDDADLNKLTQAEATYAGLLAQAVAAVKEQIDALPDTPLTDATKKLSEYNKVTDAREAYDALSDEEKAAVTNYGKLEAAEAAFAAIGGGTGLNVSTEDIGKVLCADGSLYATKDEATAASKTPVAMIAYVEDSKGLAIALEDESNTMIWSTAITTAAAHTPAVTGGTWKLPSLLEWQQMFVGCGADLTPSETSGAVTDYIGLRDKLLAAGGKGFVEWSYWTTTEWANNPAEAWDPYFSFSPELVKWYTNKKDRDDFYIRAILAFNVVASKALADAQAAKDLIDAIPSPVVVTDDCKAKIDAARDAVTALGENASLLDDADIDKLAKAESDFALLIKDATAVAGMIDAIGEVTFSAESKGKIVDAREAYEALSDELKSYVSNLDKLTAAEAAYEAARPFATVTTVPAAVEALQYTGAAQTLITAGAAEHGTVLYSLDGENYSAELPTALLPGAYTIYYKVQATDDYKDVAPVTVIATIAYNYPATYGLFGIPEGWSVKVNDEEVAVVNGAVKNIAANDRFDIMPVKPEDVKRVEIVPYLLDLATVTDSVIYILDGDSITGTANGHITVVIVPDAKVYFKDVNLTNTGSHPAVLCGGNAEIVVVGENTITCTKEGEYGIRAAGAGTTLTISGDKTLLNADINPNGGTVNQ
ncbi:MAG: Ig-like domain-containing protein [Paludibacteraceae bacterium]|nr:Ig-like domain-containing protein [Paludibacteraceae bacterium]